METNNVERATTCVTTRPLLTPSIAEHNKTLLLIKVAVNHSRADEMYR